MMRLLISGLSSLFLIADAAFAEPDASLTTERSFDLRLWPEGAMPGKHTSQAEIVEKHGEAVRIAQVSTPLITIYPATSSSKLGAAIIICPGGSYIHLGYSKEGTEVAAWLNRIGITGIVLKYRVPQNRGGAFDDLQRAIRLVRANAKTWHIDPSKIGVMGFSAGGHLAARLSANHDHATYETVDTADQASLRPDFTLLVYPAYLEKDGLLAPEFSKGKDLPPVFIAQTEDDLRFVKGSKLFEAYLENTHTPHEFLLLATGGHGYGLQSDKEIKVWPERAQAWLKTLKVP